MGARFLTTMFAGSLALWGAAAFAGDAAAGKAKADEACADCHEAADWAGEQAAAIEAMIKDVVAGQVKHKGKVELTAEEIANIAAYWAASGE